MSGSAGSNALRALPLSLRLAAFRALEALADRRTRRPGAPGLQSPQASRSKSPAKSLWVFVSTIGELNAIEPFLQRLLVELGQPRLTLLSDRTVYADAYRARHPDADVVFLSGSSAQARQLAQDAPPMLLVVAEIPALLHDAPCRLSFATVHAARAAGAPVVLVNGWGYGYRPPSRMDLLETALFGADYLQTFDLLLVQTPEFAARLLTAGAAAERVVVVGNLKFDAMDQTAWSPAQARSPVLLSALLAAQRNTIVAGCVTDADEQERVLDAFGQLQRQDAHCLLVLAPRHPENPAVMQRLRALLAERGLACAFRSELPDAPLAASVAVLVLDTMGELRDFYAAARVAHVGVDHNVLEPMRFGKPVTVSPGWDKTYPSYPVYRLLRQQDALLQAADADSLRQHWARCLAQDGTSSDAGARTRQALAAASGATERHFRALNPWLAALRGRTHASA